MLSIQQVQWHDVKRSLDSHHCLNWVTGFVYTGHPTSLKIRVCRRQSHHRKWCSVVVMYLFHELYTELSTATRINETRRDGGITTTIKVTFATQGKVLLLFKSAMLGCLTYHFSINSWIKWILAVKFQMSFLTLITLLRRMMLHDLWDNKIFTETCNSAAEWQLHVCSKQAIGFQTR